MEGVEVPTTDKSIKRPSGFKIGPYTHNERELCFAIVSALSPEHAEEMIKQQIEDWHTWGPVGKLYKRHAPIQQLDFRFNREGILYMDLPSVFDEQTWRETRGPHDRYRKFIER